MSLLWLAFKNSRGAVEVFIAQAGYLMMAHEGRHGRAARTFHDGHELDASLPENSCKDGRSIALAKRPMALLKRIA